MDNNNNGSNNNTSSGYKMLFLCGGKASVLTFNCETDGHRYAAELNKICGVNQAIVADGGLEGLAPKIFKRRVKHFNKLCRAFRKNWGDACLPEDVKFAWNDGEFHLGLPITTFN
jgi:hypothetical protein